jgi:uncharacterized LabA/DUF88 family protein
MANFLYVDNSNVWIEGMHVAAVQQGVAPNIWVAQGAKITVSFRLDFGRLHEFAGGDRSSIGRAVLYGSRPPANDSLWKMAESRGFEVVVFDRNAANREKKIDTQITADIIEDALTRMMPGSDEVTLVSGDRDYVPAVEKVRSRGVAFHVVFWAHAARELRDAASSFTELDGYLDHLSL